MEEAMIQPSLEGRDGNLPREQGGEWEFWKETAIKRSSTGQRVGYKVEAEKR
jgi:hypothetical protein